MAYLHTTFRTQKISTIPILNDAFVLRFGKREIRIRKDFRKRFYHTNPLIECRAGDSAGHVEILLLRYWLVIFSKAQD